MADTTQARATVTTYLAGQFPGATISDAFGFDPSTHWWRVTTPSHDVLLHVSIEFLRDYSTTQITEALNGWGVADALKGVAPERFVLVTRDGLREKPWPPEAR
jgi:hypothetical protein